MSVNSHNPIHGNYHGYYNKRPSTSDQRLSLVPQDFFEGKRVLDVGCNEGFVTCEIAQTLGAKRIIGVDIDDALVRAAWRHRRSVWTQQGPIKKVAQNEHNEHYGDTENGADTYASSDKRKRRRLSDRNPEPERTGAVSGIPGYFPVSCEHMYGPLPIPDHTTMDNNIAEKFPHNVSFRAADWVNSEIPEDTDGYDVVVAFSISKWIHLNGGDDGLLTFFRRVHAVLRPAGTFILEPQEWDSYAKAKRMDTRLKENAKQIRLRPEDFEHVLKEIGFGAANHLGSPGQGGFRRSIDLYVKNP